MFLKECYKIYLVNIKSTGRYRQSFVVFFKNLNTHTYRKQLLTSKIQSSLYLYCTYNLLIIHLWMKTNDNFEQ